MQLRKKIKVPKKYDDTEESELESPKSISKMKPIPYNPNLPPAAFPTIGFGEVAKSDINVSKVTNPSGDCLNQCPTKDNKRQETQEEYLVSDGPNFADNRGAAESFSIQTSEEWFAAEMETSDEGNGYGAQDEIKNAIPDRSEWDDLSVAHQTEMVIKLEETYKVKRLAAMRQLQLNQRQIRHTMELLDRRDILERREHQGVTDTLDETRQILMTGDKDGSRYISEERYREILQTRLYGPAQGRDQFHITTLRDLAKAKRYFRNSGHDPKLLDANWEDAFEGDRMSSTSAKSESKSPSVGDQRSSASTISISSAEKSSAGDVSAEPDMDPTLRVHHYYPLLPPFVRPAGVGKERNLAQRIQENESKKGFLSVPAINISRSRIPAEDTTISTRNHPQGNSPSLVHTFAAAASATHSSNLLQLPSRTSDLHPPHPPQPLRPTLPDQGQIFSASSEPVRSSTREPSLKRIMRRTETLQSSTRRKCSANRCLSEPPSPKRARIKEGENPLMDQPGAAASNREINKVACPRVVQPSVPVSNWMPELPKFDNPALPTSSKPAKVNAAFRASAISSNATVMMPTSANSTRPPSATHTMAKLALSSNAEKAQKLATVAATQLETPRPQSEPAFASIVKAAKAKSATSSMYTMVPTATMFTQDSTATTTAPAPNVTLSTPVSQAAKKLGDTPGTSTDATGTRPGVLLSIPGTTPNSITAGEVSDTFITAQQKLMPAVLTLSKPALPTSVSAPQSKPTAASGPNPSSAKTPAVQKKTRRAPAKRKVKGVEEN